MTESKNIELTFDGEDHTLGVLLRNELLENNDIIFAAYMVPHPLKRSVKIRVQTNEKSAIKAVKKAAVRVERQLDELAAAFDNA